MDDKNLEAALEQALRECEDVVQDSKRERTRLFFNAYYLFEEATRAVRTGASRSEVVEEVFRSARHLGAAGVITNAFNNDPEKIGDSTLQLAPGRYDDVAWAGLDLLLEEATRQQIGVWLTLGNYWDAYGGARQYVRWSGLPEAREGDPRFFREKMPRSLYHAFITDLLEHISLREDVSVAEHPAVIGFEILNEARGRGLDGKGAELAAWLRETATLVRGLAPSKLLSSGEEGFDISLEGYSEDFWTERVQSTFMFESHSSFQRHLQEVRDLDVASVHLYPEAWQIGKNDPLLAAVGGLVWIGDHARLAQRTGRRLFLGEFGLRNDGHFTLEERRTMYRAWMQCADAVGAWGVAPWLLGVPSAPQFHDGYTFMVDSEALSGTDANPYGDIFER